MAPKVNGEGSIIQLEKDKPKGKCRRWQLRVPIGKDPRTGKYRTRTRRVTGTYTEAVKALRGFIEEIEGDRATQRRTGTTFRECADDFQRRRRESGNFSDNTHDSYGTCFKAACKHIGEAEVSSITKETLEDMYAAMRRGDTLSGKRSSATYIQEIHQTISLMFDDLVNGGVLARNPCDSVKAPQRDTKERRALKPERMREMLKQLSVEDEHDMAYFLAIALGLRRGEICALSWGDIDIDDATLTVRHNFDRHGSLKATKTRAGFRVLALPDFVCDALRRHRDAQRERFVRAGREASLGSSSPVILHRSFGRVNPVALGIWWRRDRAALGLDDWCLHELRHSYLSMLALQGVHPRVMQEIAGHANFSTTMNIYAHVNIDAKREAALASANVLDNEKGNLERNSAGGSDASKEPTDPIPIPTSHSNKAA